MTFKEVYKFPLKVDEHCDIITWTADKQRAFDWLSNFTPDCQKKVIAIINGEQKPPYKGKFYRDGIEIWHKGLKIPILRIRGWGYLTGVGGLHLSEEEAIRIQDEFGDYIVEQLNKN